MQTIILFIAAFFGTLILMILLLRFYFNRQVKKKRIHQHTHLPGKKYKGAELRPHYTAFFLTGLVFALAATIIAFSWTTYQSLEKAFDTDFYLPEDEVEIQLTASTIYRAPQPPPAAPPIISIIDDDEKVTDVEEKTKDPGEIEEIYFNIGPDIGFEPEPVPDEDSIHLVSEQMPKFPGGDAAFYKYIRSVNYPEIARSNHIDGTVFVYFVVDRDGNVTDVKVLRGADRLLNAAAVRHIQNMPQWTPGYHKGIPVNVSFTIPIRFVLRD